MAGRVPAHPSSHSLVQGQLTSPPRGLMMICLFLVCPKQIFF